jgi:hypothetical protein
MFAIIATSANAALAKAVYDSFSPGAIWLDNHGVVINAHGGGILLYRRTYYWFGEHKIAGEAGNVAHVGVHVYSSKDLYNWSDRGIALPISSDPNSEITDGSIIERAKVIYNAPTRKFVMWFHLELKGQGYAAARSGVAIATRPEGPYRYLGSFRPDAGIWPRNVTSADKVAGTLVSRDFASGQMSRDQNLFVDDDGSAYQIFSSEDNSVMDLSKLSSDYTKPAGEYERFVLPINYREAPAMFKHDGKYYLMSSATSGWDPNPADMSVADNIWGPYKSLGNPCIGMDANTTFHSQSTYILPIETKAGTQYIYLGDRWNPTNAIDGRYIWLPLNFVNGSPQIVWKDHWTLKDLGG